MNLIPVEIVLPGLDETQSITWNLHVNDSKGKNRYDMILGRYILPELKGQIWFYDQTMRENGRTYKGYTTPMKDVSNINLNVPPDWINGEISWEKYKW